MSGPLSGIRVVEATFYQYGPYAGVMLADLGADVIKIEPPVTGDPGRGIDAVDPKLGNPPYHQAQNRSKRSIALDLNKPAGLEAAYRLIETADVFLQNYRAGVAERLGLGYAALKARNPGLIYASATGLGREGPDAHLPVLDSIGMARGGMMMLQHGEEDEPFYVMGPFMADQAGAMTLAYAILGAIVHRLRTGEGQELEVSQLGSILLFQQTALQRYLLNGLRPERFDRRRAPNPLWNQYRCGDGKWLVLALSQADRFWPAFCAAVERPDWLAEAGYATIAERGRRATELIDALEALFASQPRAFWLERLRAAELLAGPIQDYAQLLDDPQVAANGYLPELPLDFGGSVRVVGNPVHYSASPTTPPARAPDLGQHTETVLLELGYDWDAIQSLRAGGAI